MSSNTRASRRVPRRSNVARIDCVAEPHVDPQRHRLALDRRLDGHLHAVVIVGRTVGGYGANATKGKPIAYLHSDDLREALADVLGGLVDEVRDEHAALQRELLRLRGPAETVEEPIDRLGDERVVAIETRSRATLPTS
jgi:hypothetical protein